MTGAALAVAISAPLGPPWLAEPVVKAAVHVPTLADIDAAIAAFDWDAWEAELLDALDVAYWQAVEASGALTGGEAWDSRAPGIRAFGREYLAQRVTQVSATTKERVRGAVVEALTQVEGFSMQGLATLLREEFAQFAGARALAIARTEVATALNHGAAFGFRLDGFSYVEVSDGDSDPECAEADGQIWTIEYFLANALEHPNCERSAAPVSDEDAALEGVDEGEGHE